MQMIKTECFPKLFPLLRLFRSSMHPSPFELPPLTSWSLHFPLSQRSGSLPIHLQTCTDLLALYLDSRFLQFLFKTSLYVKTKKIMVLVSRIELVHISYVLQAWLSYLAFAQLKLMKENDITGRDLVSYQKVKWNIGLSCSLVGWRKALRCIVKVHIDVLVESLPCTEA